MPCEVSQASVLLRAKSQSLTENTNAKKLCANLKMNCVWRSKVWQQAGLGKEMGAGTWQLGRGRRVVCHLG